MDDGGSSIAGYPMVEEGQASGRVAAVYADLLATGMPFVPSLFKSLALCPAYLVLAHDQATGVLGTTAFSEAAQDLVDSVRDACRPPQDRDVREELAQFVPPLARMLLVTTGLHAALDDRLHVPSAQPQELKDRTVRPAASAPSTADVAEPELFGQIRAALQTPIVNSIWRSLAASGRLEAAWSVLAPQVDTAWPIADRLESHALTVAARLPWTRAANMQALAECGVDDAAPGMRAVLGAYRVTLPRVLTLVASSAGDER